jgi:NitT/TauT family transport system substrate-binding protein
MRRTVQFLLALTLSLSPLSVLSAKGVQAGTLVVAYNQWAGFAPVFVAKEKGFFEAAGVSVELKSFAGPGDSIAPLMAGHLDASLTTPDNVIAMNARGGTLRCVYMIDASDGADAVVAKKSIATVADLKGKKIGTTLGEVNHLLLLKALEKGGLTEKDVTLVNMSPDDAGAAFIAGNLAAAVTWEPWVSKAASEGGGYSIFTSADAPNLLLDVVAVSDQTLADRSADILALVQGIAQGVEYLKTNPAESYALAGKWLGVSGSEVEGMLGGVKLYTAADNVMIFEKRTPLVDPLKSISAFLLAQGKIEKQPDVEAMVVTSVALKE